MTCLRFVLVLAFAVASSLAEPSVTTSVWKGVRKTHESGELIFEVRSDPGPFLS